MSKILEQMFEETVKICAETGKLISLPSALDRRTCGNIMARIAGEYIDSGQDIKAIIILEERRRLNV